MSLNKSMVTGYVKRDPHTAFVPGSGAQVTSFTVKSTRTYRNKEKELVREDTYHRCVAFAGMAESISQNVHDDDYIYVEGRMKARKYNHKKYPEAVVEIQEIVIEGWHFEGRAKDKTPKPEGE